MQIAGAANSCANLLSKKSGGDIRAHQGERRAAGELGGHLAIEQEPAEDQREHAVQVDDLWRR